MTNRSLEQLQSVLDSHAQVRRDGSRAELVEAAVSRREALVSECGALATWTRPDSTGRSPKDTYIIQDEVTKETVDWTSPANIPLERATFESLWDDALALLKGKEQLFVSDRVVGADASYALPVKTVTDSALSSLFVMNMFREVPKDLNKSTFFGDGFTLLALPKDEVHREKYEGKLPGLKPGRDPMVIAMDFTKRQGLVYGSWYMGSCKKLIFTVMNYLLPEKNLLPLHCSANEGDDGKLALFLGLSGTGKTTLSADASRHLLGDDEHGWSDNGIANFENGCYAKLIHLNPDKEPDIYDATFRNADPKEHGAIIENCMMYPEGYFDVDDDRFTPNSRASYPLTSLKNIKESSCGDHPSHILFLTADAYGVLPPVSRLSADQAMLWFLMGYTSKLAGTETGVTTPQATFSRFFGGPFMPRLPGDYTKLFGERVEKHGSKVYLINTGWSGGAYGTGSRMDINITRTIVNAVLNSELDNIQTEEDPLFHLSVPVDCPGVESKILKPINTWADKGAYETQAKELAQKFSDHFDKAYAQSNVTENVRAACPGK